MSIRVRDEAKRAKEYRNRLSEEAYDAYVKKAYGRVKRQRALKRAERIRLRKRLRDKLRVLRMTDEQYKEYIRKAVERTRKSRARKKEQRANVGAASRCE